jgi:outer membrane protein, multidrug efflux system
MSESDRKSAARQHSADKEEKMPGRAASAARPAERGQRYEATKFAGTILSSTRTPTPFPSGSPLANSSPRGVTCGQHGGIAAGFRFDSDIRSARSRRARPAGSGLVLVLTLLASVTVVGCMVGPDYRPPAMKLPTHWDGNDQQIKQVENQEDKTDLATWWQSFDDPILNQLVAQALSSNLDQKIALARVREERAYLVISRAGLFPSVDMSGSYTRQRYSANTPFGFFPQLLPRDENIYEAGFDASWELDIFGGIRRGIEASNANLAASIENSRDVRVAMLAEVARDYVAVRALERRLQIAKANLRDQNDSLSLAQARFEQGFAPELDVFQARSLLETTQARVPELESELAQTVHRIGVLLGREPDALQAKLSDMAPIPGIADPDAIAVRIPAALPSDLLRRRPDIRAAEREIAAATARVGVATADLYPKFSITGTAGLESISPGNFFFGTSRMWQVGPTMTWPIFEAGRIRAYIEVRNAQEEQALLSYRKTVLIALAEVEDGLVAYANERTRHQALAASAQDFKRSQLLALDRYEEGYATYLDVLEAQRSLYAAQDSLAQSDQQLIDDLIAIYKALGGGWQTDPQIGSVFEPTPSEGGQAPPSRPSRGINGYSPAAVAENQHSPVSVARGVLPPLPARDGATGRSFFCRR